MGKIVIYGAEQIRQLVKRVGDSYVKNLTQMLTFEDWKCTALPILHDHPADFGVKLIDYSEPIKVCPTVSEMLATIAAHQEEYTDIKLHAKDEEKNYKITQLLKEIIKPSLIVDRKAGFSMKGTTGDIQVDVPMWFNSTLEGISLRLGYANMDSATPSVMRLGDDCVHAMLGGATGSGKSVTMHAMIASGMLEYPPWELAFYLADMKVVELSRYGNRVAAPNVEMIGATGSTVFVMSMLDYIRKEMMSRQELFEKCGVENIKSFRKKFGMALPRIILFIDEFMQLYENLKDAEQAGCSNIDEQKSTINSSISSIARLGRNAGVHMLLSSQSLDGALDEQVSNQFKAGATLYAGPAVSKALIGNDAGVRIVGKGKGIYNLNKMAQSEAGNVYCRIPFIQSEISEKDEAEGKIPYLQEILIELRKLADSIGYTKRLYMYNEKEEIPFELFSEDLRKGQARETNPGTGDEITDNIFREEVTKVITIGRSVAYDPDGVATVDLKLRRNHSILVAATDIADRVYMLKLFIENFKGVGFKHYVVAGDKAIFEMTGIGTSLERVQVLRQKSLPMDVWAIYKNRNRMLTSYTMLEDAGKSEWDSAVLLPVFFKKAGVQCTSGAVTAFDQVLSGKLPEDQLTAALEKSGIDSYKLDKATSACASAVSTKKALERMTNNFEDNLTPNSFERIILWFLGIDEHADMQDSEGCKVYLELAGQGPLVGIHSIVTGEHWNKAGRVAEACNFILERCGKSFFTDCDLPVQVNINNNSFQLIDRMSVSSNVIIKYKIQ